MSPLDPLEPGLLIRIDPATAKVITTKCPVQATSHGASAGTDIRQILDRIDRYNRDVLRNKTLIASSPHLAASGEDPSFAVTDLIFRASDALSALFAKTVRNSDGLIYALALGAVAVFNFVTNKAWAPSIYLGHHPCHGDAGRRHPGAFRRQPISGIPVPCGSGENAVLLAQCRCDASALDHIALPSIGSDALGPASCPLHGVLPGWAPCRKPPNAGRARHCENLLGRRSKGMAGEEGTRSPGEIQVLEMGIAACDRRLLRHSHRSCFANGYPDMAAAVPSGRAG